MRSALTPADHELCVRPAMAATDVSATFAGESVRCAACRGTMVLVSSRDRVQYRRCSTCGRDERPLAMPSKTLMVTSADCGSAEDCPGAPVPLSGPDCPGAPVPLSGPEKRPPAPSVKCAVDGCPGFHAPGKPCPCCEKREAWENDHRPRKLCAVCGGPFTGRGRRKYCRACAVAVQRVSAAKSKGKL